MKTTRRHHCTPTRTAKFKRLSTGVGKEPLKHCSIHLELSYNVKHSITISSTNPTLSYLPKRNKDICPQNVATNVCSSFIHQGSTLEMFHMNINRRMDKQIVAYPYSAHLSNKKECSTDWRREKSQKHAEWKEPDRKEYGRHVPNHAEFQNGKTNP